MPVYCLNCAKHQASLDSDSEWQLQLSELTRRVVDPILVHESQTEICICTTEDGVMKFTETSEARQFFIHNITELLCNVKTVRISGPISDCLAQTLSYFPNLQTLDLCSATGVTDKIWSNSQLGNPFLGLRCIHMCMGPQNPGLTADGIRLLGRGGRKKNLLRQVFIYGASGLGAHDVVSIVDGILSVHLVIFHGVLGSESRKFFPPVQSLFQTTEGTCIDEDEKYPGDTKREEQPPDYLDTSFGQPVVMPYDEQDYMIFCDPEFPEQRLDVMQFISSGLVYPTDPGLTNELSDIAASMSSIDLSMSSAMPDTVLFGSHRERRCTTIFEDVKREDEDDDEGDEKRGEATDSDAEMDIEPGGCTVEKVGAKRRGWKEEVDNDEEPLSFEDWF